MPVLLDDPLLDALRETEGKAEIVGGQIVPLLSTGFLPSYAAFQVAKALDLYAAEHGGFAATATLGFVVDLPGRRSFSPGAAYFLDAPDNPGFVQGPPLFAVEVRSERDRGPRAEREIAAKRADYFAAGTRAVWDVDLKDDRATVWLYASADAEPETFGRDGSAHAGDALPGFAMDAGAMYPTA